MEVRASKLVWQLVTCLCVLPSFGQQSPSSFDAQAVPSNFKVDLETAARLRPQLAAQSAPAGPGYAIARSVFERLVGQVAPASAKTEWQLRIVNGNDLNAFSSPDGTIYVERGLAQLAGTSAGLWAAILSHEIAHVVRRDWARRYLYVKYLQTRGGAPIVLGDPGLPSSGWQDPTAASIELGLFCRQMEVEADRDGLMVMAHAGYHPDFVPALHHLLHAHGSGTNVTALGAMHPCWEERDRELSKAYVAASIEFARRWPEWYASPGGNPPVVVFAEEPHVRKIGAGEWQIQLPMRCQNLAGTVEVVLREGAAQHSRPGQLSDQGGLDSRDLNSDFRQLTGCTSPKTTVTFRLGDSSTAQKAGEQFTDIYVLDAQGAVLARTEIPKLPR